MPTVLASIPKAILEAAATYQVDVDALLRNAGLTHEPFETANARIPDDAALRLWRVAVEATGLPTILSGLREGLDSPLLFDPGTRWDYGIGIDWLGQVIEKVDGRSIDRFCREEILEPLAMTDT